MNDWKKYKPTSLWHPYSNCIYQKKLYEDSSDNEIFANIAEYPPRPYFENNVYQLDIQIPQELSVTNNTINVECFNYDKLDFEAMEKDALNLIEILTRKQK
jgi:hypothetical protein